MRFPALATRVCLSSFLLVSAASAANATEWFVVQGGSGTGAATAPFGRIRDGVNAARPGDTVTIGPGTYAESIASVRSGTATQRILIRSVNPGSVVVTRSGRVLTVNHAYVTVDGLVLDGQYGADDGVRVTASGTGFTLRNSEVRRTTKDAIDMGAVHDVLIEHTSIHHALNAAGGRTDAHGVVAGAVRGLTIRGCDIYAFSGDGVQVDPGRAAPGWDNVIIEDSRIWLEPLTTPENGFPLGAVTGENAIDTKAAAGLPRAHITIRNVEMWGFTNGLIANMAAFNLKENVDAVVDGAIVHHSNIAFRLRGPGSTGNGAWVRIQNAILHDLAYGFRYEDDIEHLRISNSTLGVNVTKPFHQASSSRAGLDVENLLLLAGGLPAEASGFSNMAVDAAAFVNPAAHNYALADGSPAIDTGTSLAEVTHDVVGTARPQGIAYDVGAHEYAAGGGSPPTITLTARGYLAKGLQRVELRWSGAQSPSIDMYRNGVLVRTLSNDGRATDRINLTGSTTYVYRVCEAGTSTCSSEEIVAF